MYINIRQMQRHGLGANVNSIVMSTLGKLFGKYLLITNTVTSGLLMGAGDIIQQELEIRRGDHKNTVHDERYDWKRINRMFWVGLSQGPPQHYFYGIIDQYFPKRNLKTVVRKILLDQLLASPICIVQFFVGMGWLEGRSKTEITQELKEKFIIVYAMDWIVWPPGQLINFWLIPPKYRVIYVNFMTMIYNIFLSYVKHDID